MASHAHEHDHAHDPVTFVRSEVAEPTLTQLRALHPALADELLLARRFDELGDEDKKRLVQAHQKVEAHEAWLPGFHAAGDRCAACETPLLPLFVDRFATGELAYAAFVDDVPVHARKDCLDGFAAKFPKRAPQLLDRLRREFTMERGRPGARMVQFFRGDLFAQPPFELADWANSVAEANPRMERATLKEIERLLQWAHERLYH